MTEPNLIADLIANGHRAQIIHQGGLLIYANTAAARIFGFSTITEFVRFAKAAEFFASDEVVSIQPQRRIMNFVRVDGQPKCAHVREQRVDWNGVASTLLEVALVEPETISDDTTQGSEFFVLDTISSVLDSKRLDADRLEVIRQPFDAASVVFQFCEDMEGYAASSSVSLNVEITPRAQKIFEGDASKFARAGASMLRQAIDRVQGGRVDIILKADEVGEHLMLEICDNGIAYTAIEQQLLFDVSAGEVGANPISNIESFLNLPLARCIAAHLGGTVGLRINHPHGGVIRMRLPFPQVYQGQHTLRCVGQRHRKLDILVVEDNQSSQTVIKTILETLGHRPTVVNNGKECLEILQQVNFDIIFMDLHMPVQDGYAATQSIRAREGSGVLLYKKPIPILALTADRRPETRTKALAMGVTGFLSKPVHVPQIMGALAPYIQEFGSPLVELPAWHRASRDA